MTSQNLVAPEITRHDNPSASRISGLTNPVNRHEPPRSSGENPALRESGVDESAAHVAPAVHIVATQDYDAGRNS